MSNYNNLIQISFQLLIIANLIYILLHNKELEKKAKGTQAELANYEREDINLGERKKYANSKQKKVTNAFSKVRFNII